MAGKSPNPNRGKQAKPRSGKGLIIVFIIALAIIIVAWLYWTYGGLPSTVLSTLISRKQLNGTTLESIMFQRVDSESQFAVNYTGGISINSDPYIFFGFAKYYGDKRYQIIMNNLTGFGSPDIFYYINYSTPQNDYICVSGSPLLANGITGSAAGLYGKCFYTQSNYNDTNMLLNSFVDSASLKNVSISSYGLGSHLGMPCYKVSGTGTIDINSIIVGSASGRYIPASLNFSSCLSAKYNIPLSLNATFKASNGATVEMNLNEVLLVSNNTAALLVNTQLQNQ